MSVAVLQNSTFSTLSPVQAQVVEALAQGSTITAAAGAAGLHRTTAVLERPHFPEQDWHLPDPIASTEEQRLLRDLACMKADDKLLSMEEKINRHARESIEEPAGDDPADPSSPACHDSTAAQAPGVPQATPRNAPCPCGSGLKFKRCCGRGEPAMPATPARYTAEAVPPMLGPCSKNASP